MTMAKATTITSPPTSTELNDEALERVTGGSGGSVSDGFELVYHKIQVASGANFQFGDGSVRIVK